MRNTISSSIKTLLMDKVKNSIPLNGVTSYSRKIIHQFKNLLVKSSFNIKTSVKKVFLKQRKIKFAHYKEMQNNISILRHEIRDLKNSLPIHLRDLKNKISHEIDSKLIIENKKEINLLHDKLNEISTGIYNKNNKVNNSNNDIKNDFTVCKKVEVEHFHRPIINIQENSEKSVSQLFQLINNSLRVPSDAQSEARANAKSRRQSLNYDDNKIATATTTTISDLEGTNLSPEMIPAKKSSALQEAGRKVMQDSKNSLAAFTAASHNTTQALHDLTPGQHSSLMAAGIQFPLGSLLRSEIDSPLI